MLKITTSNKWLIHIPAWPQIDIIWLSYLWARRRKLTSTVKNNKYEYYTINEGAGNGGNRCPVRSVRRILCKWHKRGNTAYGSLALLRETLITKMVEHSIFLRQKYLTFLLVYLELLTNFFKNDKDISWINLHTFNEQTLTWVIYYRGRDRSRLGAFPLIFFYLASRHYHRVGLFIVNILLYFVYF